MKKLYALRGAAQCENTEDDIIRQVGLMYEELLSKNNLKDDDIVSVIFSITNDLDAINPAAALRKFKNIEVIDLNFALFCVQEPQIKNSLKRTVRMIIHCYLDEGSKPDNVYRNGAEVLRK